MNQASDDRSPQTKATELGFTGVRKLGETAVRLTGTDGAAVALLDQSLALRELVYATDAIAQQVDELQFTVGEGPRLTACREGKPEIVPDLAEPASNARWPIFTSEVRELGVEAVFAFPIAVQGAPFGALELLSP